MKRVNIKTPVRNTNIPHNPKIVQYVDVIYFFYRRLIMYASVSAQGVRYSYFAIIVE